MSIEVHLRSILYGAGIAVLLTLSTVNVYLLRTVKEANQTIRATNSTLDATTNLVNGLNQSNTVLTNKLNAKLDDFGRVLYSVDGTVANIRKASIVWSQAGAEQAATTTQAAEQVVTVLKDTDRAVNDLDGAVTQTAQSIQPVVIDLADAAKGLSKDVNDPAIADVFLNLDHTSHDFTTMADIAVGDSQLADKRFRQLMKPMSIGERLMKSGLTTSVQILEGWFYGRADF